MRTTALLIAIAAGTFALSGCVGYVPVPVGINATYYDGPPQRARRDRDGDGVPDRYDRRPNNPNRY